jgi:SEC-C motif-containing protein
VKVGPNQPCPCGSGAKFKRCCRPFHRGAPAPTPEAVMRSRYSAYASGAVDYVIDTTHPKGNQFQGDRQAWARGVETFCEATTFQGLEVIESKSEGDTAHVTFRATLAQGESDASFTEESTFFRVEGRWLYHSGNTLSD